MYQKNLIRNKNTNLIKVDFNKKWGKLKMDNELYDLILKNATDKLIKKEDNKNKIEVYQALNIENNIFKAVYTNELRGEMYNG